MNETEFLAAADAELNRLQDAVEAAFDDVDCSRAGHVLTMELDSGAQVVVNIQTPMREIWLASHFGGHHFAPQAGAWVDPKTSETLEAAARCALCRLRG